MKKFDWDLEWNVILPSTRCTYFNIFNSVRFREFLIDLRARHKKDPTIDLKNEIIFGAMYSFCHKAEYEITAKSWLGGNIEHLVDAYFQIYMNYEKFYDYLMANWERIPAKTYKQQRNARSKQ